MKSFPQFFAAAALTATTLIVPSAFAVNPRILSVSNTMFPGANLPNYTTGAQDQLMAVATDFCKKFNEQVDKVTNIVIQVQAEFEPDGATKLKATNLPQVNYSGLVSCKPAFR